MKTKNWKANTFNTAQAWIRASVKGQPIDDQYVEALASVCTKRRGVWNILRNVPSDDRAVVWHAFKIARHAIEWGDMSAWHSDTTSLLMRSTDEQRELFEYMYDTTLLLAKNARARA